MAGDTSPLAGFALLMVAFVAYFLPAFIASHRKHPNAAPIFLIDLLLGWTFIGWLVALIWAASAIKKDSGQAAASQADDKYQSLERLGTMKERGLIDDDEYQKEKLKLLGS